MKVVTFGEIMLRLNPIGYERFIQANQFVTTYTGAESNVAVSLANYGVDVDYVTKVPTTEIGQSAVNTVRKYGVGTKFIVRGGDRLGLFYCEKGASQRPSKVIYDRAHSAIAEASPDEFDWTTIFDGVDWFHFTGITPALSSNTAQMCLEACKQAKKMGITISCDLNYRKKLWTREQAKETMSKLMQYVDVCIGNEEDAKDVFGIEAENTDIYSGKIDKDGYVSVAKQLADKFNFKYVAFTLRESLSASDNNWSGMLYFNGKAVFSQKYAIRLVDRVGGGDSFGGGLIYSLLNKFDCQRAIEFAVAASALKQTIEGDYNLVSLQEVENLLAGDGSGRVQR